MRPKNLKFPFSWSERKPAFHEGVFIVPQYYTQHDTWRDETGLFQPSVPQYVEYCSGNGDWILEKAKANPHIRWIAVEKKLERVRKIWSKMHNLGVDNLLIVCGEALTFTKFYLSENSVEQVFVNFPDPWPKARHAKHRLIQESFVSEIERVVQPEGKATFATDHKDYSQQMIAQMKTEGWSSAFEAPYYRQHWENYGNSWFQELWEEKGRDFYYMQWIRQHEHANT